MKYVPDLLIWHFYFHTVVWKKVKRLNSIEYYDT